MSAITIPQSFSDALVELAEQGAPKEMCALLVGKRDDMNTIITDIILVDNVDKNPQTRFSIASEDLLEGYKLAQSNGEDIVGIFHSHPKSEAKPSKTDIQYMTANPVVWVIHSVRDNEMRAYTLDKSGNSSEITLDLKP